MQFVVFKPKEYSFTKEALPDESKSKEETSKESYEEESYKEIKSKESCQKETGKESKKEITIFLKKIIKQELVV